ncbi:uncharacterized protein [Ptychodera flava]|uniref:uncharacterized protein n=1 Tax=Ptychodera flava TaxID=63121 RepID=UPI00396A2331
MSFVALQVYAFVIFALIEIQEVVAIKRWDDASGQCGTSFPLMDGSPAECEPTSDQNTVSCCVAGVCDPTSISCDCADCLNYSDFPELESCERKFTATFKDNTTFAFLTQPLQGRSIRIRTKHRNGYIGVLITEDNSNNKNGRGYVIAISRNIINVVRMNGQGSVGLLGVILLTSSEINFTFSYEGSTGSAVFSDAAGHTNIVDRGPAVPVGYLGVIALGRPIIVVDYCGDEQSSETSSFVGRKWVLGGDNVSQANGSIATSGKQVHVPTLDAATLCMWVKSSDLTHTKSIVTYGTLSQPYLQLSRLADMKVFAFPDARVVSGVSVYDSLWHHICLRLRFDLPSLQVTLFKDGDQVFGIVNLAPVDILPEGQQFLIGGGVDPALHPTTGFPSDDAGVHFELTEFNVWSLTLPKATIKEMFKLCLANGVYGDVVSWAWFGPDDIDGIVVEDLEESLCDDNCLWPSNKVFPNGTVNGDNADGGVLTFQCDEGYKMVGPNSWECSKGTWLDDRVPKCFKVSAEYSLLELPVTSFEAVSKCEERGEILAEIHNKDIYDYVSALVMEYKRYNTILTRFWIGATNDKREGTKQSRDSCTYTFVGMNVSARLPCMIIRASDGAIKSLNCVPDNKRNVGAICQTRDACHDDPSIEHGEYTCEYREDGKYFEYVCNDEYEIHGNGSRQCINGLWSGERPQCIKPTSTTGSMTTATSTTGSMTTTIPTTRSTAEDDTGSCRVAFSSLVQRIYGDGVVLNFQCASGYRLLGHSNVRCNDGEWDYPIPTCQDIDECVEFSGLCNTLIEHKLCKNTIGSYECVCMEGFVVSEESRDYKCQRRQEEQPRRCQQSSRNEGRRCMREEIQIGNSTIVWPETVANCLPEWMPCPANAIGHMRRLCHPNGSWSEPDMMDCISVVFLDLMENVKNITQVDDAINIVETVHNFTNRDSFSYPTDLLLATSVLSETLDKHPLDMPAPFERHVNFVETTMGTMSQLLNEDFGDIWQSVSQNSNIGASAADVLLQVNNLGSQVGQFIGRTSSTPLVVNTRNIEMKVDVFRGTTNMTGYLFPSEGVWNETRTHPNMTLLDHARKHDNFVFIPANAIKALIGSNKTNQDISIVSAIYPNLAKLVKGTFVGSRKKTQRQWVKSVTAVDYSDKVNTVGISVIIQPISSDILESPDVFLRFKNLKNANNPRCAYMDFSAPYGLWNTEGCEAIYTDYSQGYTECMCSKVKSFAVIMDFIPEGFLTSVVPLLVKITATGACFLLLVTLFFSAIARIPSDTYFVLHNLLVAYVCLLSSVPIAMLVTEKNKSWCRTTALMLHALSLFCFVWMAVISVSQLALIRNVVWKTNTYRIFYVCVGWIVPIILVIASSLLLENKVDVTDEKCWLSWLTHTTTITLTLIFSALTVCLINLRQAYHLYMTQESMFAMYSPESQRVWLGLRTTIFTCLSFTATWIAGCLAMRTNANYLYGYLFSYLLLFTGAIIFLGFVAINSELLFIVRSMFSRDSETRRALRRYREVQAERMQQMRAQYIQDRNEKKIERQRKAMIRFLFQRGRHIQIHPYIEG